MASNLVTIPKYRHHKGTGQAFVQVRGKRHYLGRYGTPKSKEAYSRFVAELAVTPAAVPDPKPQTPVTITVVELAAAYLDFAEGYYRKHGQPTRTTENITRAIGTVKELYGRTTAADFGPLALLALQQKLVQRHLSRRYINAVVDCIRRMFKWGVSRQLLPASTYHALASVEGLRKGRSAAREPQPILPVDDATVDATLPHLSQVVADMVRFQRLTGCRPGEVCQLRPMDLDRSGEVWSYRPGSHKTEHHGRERVIFVGPKAKALLVKYIMGRDPAACCFSPAESEQQRLELRHAARKTPLRYGNRPGTNRKRRPIRAPSDHYSKDSYYRAIRRATDKAGLPPWAPNRLRHTRATQVRKQFGLEAAQVVLGHSKADVTQVYAERDMGLAASIMAKIG